MLQFAVLFRSLLDWGVVSTKVMRMLMQQWISFFNCISLVFCLLALQSIATSSFSQLRR